MLETRLIPYKIILVLPPVSRVRLVPGKGTNLALRIPFLVPHSFLQFPSIAGFEDYLTSEWKAVSMERFSPQTIPFALAVDALGVMVDAPARSRIRPIARWQSRCNEAGHCASDNKLIGSFSNTIGLGNTWRRRVVQNTQRSHGFYEFWCVVRICQLYAPRPVKNLMLSITKDELRTDIGYACVMPVYISLTTKHSFSALIPTVLCDPE